jgi:hypothetical protein
VLPALTHCAGMQDEDRVWIVTELCSGGDLEHFIKVSLQTRCMQTVLCFWSLFYAYTSGDRLSNDSQAWNMHLQAIPPMLKVCCGCAGLWEHDRG